jgi:hypothetical protein
VKYPRCKRSQADQRQAVEGFFQMIASQNTGRLNTSAAFVQSKFHARSKQWDRFMIDKSLKTIIFAVERIEIFEDVVIDFR